MLEIRLENNEVKKFNNEQIKRIKELTKHLDLDNKRLVKYIEKRFCNDCQRVKTWQNCEGCSAFPGNAYRIYTIKQFMAALECGEI